MKNYPVSKLQKISEKELYELRYEKLCTWIDKNKKYLSLEEMEEVVLKIDNTLKKTYKSSELGAFPLNQRNQLHSLLFGHEEKRTMVFETIKQVCIQRRIPISAIKSDARHLFDIQMALEKSNISLTGKTLQKYLSEFSESRRRITQYDRFEMQLLVREDRVNTIKKKIKDGKISDKDGEFLLIKNDEGIERLGLQTLANEISKIELLGTSENSLEDNHYSIENHPNIIWTEKQQEAIEAFKEDSVKTLVLYGGGRSGKTTVAVGLVFQRCLDNPNHQAIIARQNFNALKRSIIDQSINGFYKRTFNLNIKQNLSSPAKITLPNNATINLAGIEGSNKTSGLDAHLGNEYGTIYLNETSQISYESYKLLMTRANDPNSPIKVLIDLNPTSMNHWVYKYFIENIDPDTDEPLNDEVINSFCVLQMNPADNIKNLNPEYINMIRSLGSAHVRRFEQGEWSNFNENSIFPIDWMQWLTRDVSHEKFDYISIGVDPAVTSKETSDETGIVVCGMRREEGIPRYYVLEDLSSRYTPEQWANVVTTTYKKYKNARASKDTVVVLEKNQGGDVLNSLLRVANGGLPFPTKDETVKKDKVTRAMYISSLYEKRQVYHCQKFKKLENQMSALGMDEELAHDDRADALIHSLTYLFKITNKSIGTLYVV